MPLGAQCRANRVDKPPRFPNDAERLGHARELLDSDVQHSALLCCTPLHCAACHSTVSHPVTVCATFYCAVWHFIAPGGTPV